MAHVDPDPADPTGSPRWHVLLIGIDAYRGGASPLAGCVNDIDAIQQVLIDRLGVPAARIRRYAATLNDGVERPREVATRLPTRAHLLEAFREIAADVEAGDRVFVYYSGHGTQRTARTADGKRYHREALVPHDNFVFDEAIQEEREHLIFDWEVNAWLAELAATTTSITVILDCCCSAGATRAAVTRAGREGRARFAEPTRAGDYALAATIAPPTMSRGVALSAGSLAGCMVVAACLDDEVARESEVVDAANPAHGELTRALLARLPSGRALETLTWSEIWRGIADSVKARSPYQTPWLSSHSGRRVFCGPPTDGDLGYTVQRVGADAYQLDAGSSSGVTRGAVVAVYPPLARLRRFPALGAPADLAARTGLLRVTAAERASATAEAVAGLAPPHPMEAGSRGRLVEAAGDARLRVSLAPYDAALADRIAASKLLEVVPAGAPGDLELARCANGDRELTDDVFGPDLSGPGYQLHRIPASVLAAPPPALGLDEVVAVIEHYAAYAAPIRLARACTDLPRALRIRLLDCSRLPALIPASEADAVALDELQPDRAPSYQLRPWTGVAGSADRFTIELENVSADDLFVTLFICQNSGRVTVYASRVLVTRTSRTRVWFEATKGRALTQGLTPGRTSVLDRIVAIGTTHRAATLDHLQLDRTFEAAARGDAARGKTTATPTLWTSAIAVLRATIEPAEGPPASRVAAPNDAGSHAPHAVVRSG